MASAQIRAESPQKRLMKLYPKWNGDGNRAIGELNGLAARLDKNYHDVNTNNIARAGFSIGTGIASLTFPPAGLVGLVGHVIFFVLQKQRIKECGIDMKVLEEKLQSYHNRTEELEIILIELNMVDEKKFNFEALKKNIERSQVVLRKTLTPVILDIGKTENPQISANGKIIQEKFSLLLAHAIAQMGTEVVDLLERQNSHKITELSNDITSILKKICKKEGFLNILNAVICSEDLDSCVKNLVSSLFFKVCLQTWRETKDILKSILQGLQSFSAWVVMTPDVAFAGSVAGVVGKNAVHFAPKVFKSMGSKGLAVVSAASKMLTTLNVGVIIWDTVSLLSSAAILMNGSKTEQAQYIYKLVDVIERELEEKQKLYDQFLE